MKLFVNIARLSVHVENAGDIRRFIGVFCGGRWVLRPYINPSGTRLHFVPLLRD